MKYKSIYATLLTSLFILSMIMLPLHVYATATVWTDKADYTPGETVIISGSGFLSDTVVMITISRPDSTVDTVGATTGEFGAFSCSYQLDGIIGTYMVTATDGTNMATTTFTDASLSYSPDTVSLTIAAGASSSFTLYLSDDPPGRDPTTYTRKALIAKAGWNHMEDSWVVTNPNSFSGGPESFTKEIAVTVVVPSGATPGGYAAILKYTPREGSGCEIYLTVTAPPPTTVSITITSSPVTGSGFVNVDDNPITTPITFTWTIGSSHKLEALSPVSGGTGIQYVYTDWSDSGAQTHNYVVPGSSATVTANYKTQYYLTVVSPYDTPGGMGWYDSGATAYATLATGTISLGSGVQAVFTGWSGDASGTDLTSDPITMNGPKTATANWQIQYYLDVVTDPSTLPSIPGADWYNDCTWVQLTAPQYIPSEQGMGGVRYVFSYWDVDGTSQGTGVNPINIHMNAHHTATAHYKTQYYLTVCTVPEGLDPAPTPQSGWYDGCTYVTLTAPSTAHIGNIVYNFACWQINQEFKNAKLNPITIYMDSPKIACARYCELGDPIGDINLDGKVDMTDIATIAKHYGAKLGERNYSVACDLNLDGKIDLIDLAAAARNFSA
jgi:hypothetical protein